MSEKNYTPVEAAKKVLEKCQEMYNSQKIEKAEAIDKCGEMKTEKKEKMKAELDKCGTMKAEAVQKSDEELKKIGGGAGTPGSVATTGGPSIASQIGFGKADEKEMHPKLKGFIEKRKAKKAAKMEKMMGIGEKSPMAPAAVPNAMDKPKPSNKQAAPQAQSAAPVNAPKPALPKASAPMGKSEKKK